MKRITIRDMAKMLSISPSTVSRALSDHPDISQHTKDRVKEVATAFNYTVNLHSNFFRNRKSNIIALIIPEINMFFTPAMIKSINKVVSKTGYSLSVFISRDNYKREKKMIEQCIKWAVDGVLISLSSQTKSIDHLSKLSDFDITTVLIDRTIQNDKFHSIISDSYGSGYKAVTHLLEKGHRNILGLFGNPSLSITSLRISGFKQAIQNYNLDLNQCPIVTANNVKSIDKLLPELLEVKKEITAIFMMSDEMLARTHYNLYRLGIVPYEDISLIAISDGSFPYILHPNISFVKDSGTKLGKRTVRYLIDLIEGKKNNPKKRTILKTKLVELDSVKDIN